MRLSVSSVVKFSEGFKEAIRFARRYGLGHVDIFVAAPHFDYTRNEHISELKRLEREEGISLSLKSPGFVENLASMNPDVRELTIRFFKRLIEIGAEIEATHVTVKPGILFFPERIRRDEAIENIRNGLNELLEAANDAGITLLLENYYYPIEALRKPRDFEFMAEILEGFNCAGFALNIPHMLESGINPLQILKYKKATKLIKLIYVGPRPSPWEKTFDEGSIDDAVKCARRLLTKIFPEFLTLAATDQRVVVQLLREFV